MNAPNVRGGYPWPEVGVRPFVNSFEEGTAYWNVDILWVVLAKGEDTGNQYTLLEQICPKGSGPTPHYHDQDEWFYILEGEITFLEDGKQTVGKAGSFVTVPRGTVHSFRVDSETCRLLNGYSPAGFERLIIEGSTPAERRELPPSGTPRKAMSPESMGALLAKAGMHIVDEPDVLRGGKPADWGA